MLTELFYNRAVLFANGPKGSYRKALRSADRWKYYSHLQVAFKLALVVGLIKDKYFSAEGRSINLKVGENLVKTRRVAMVLEELIREGRLLGIRDGKIFFSKRDLGSTRDNTRKEIMQLIIERLKRIKGYGPIDEALAWRNIETKDIWEMLVPERRQGYWQRAGHFFTTWGFYDLLINWAAKDAACARTLCEHKKLEAAKSAPVCPVFRPERLIRQAEMEARSRDIESIKLDLQADNLEDIPLMKDESGETAPPMDLVISDLHLREYHHENTDDLLRFIWMAKRLNGRLILAGDTFDVWRAGGLEKCWINNTRVVNALTKLREVVLVAGNHDEFLVRLARRGGIFANPNLKVAENYVSEDKSVRIFHGHQFDRFNRPGSWLGRLITRAVTRMEMSKFRRFLEWVNRLTSGALNSLTGFIGFLFGPQLSERLLLLPKLILPARYLLDRQTKNIIEWLDSEVAIAQGLDRLKLSADKPIYFIIGHIHYAGISFMIEKLTAAVRERYGEQVQLIVTDSWTNSGGFIGDYVVASGDFVKKKVWWQRKEDLFMTEDLLG
ncbi:MAG: metallophosphoesterase [Candidatus Margulisbacteria bacterium]|nr:metallophosphoesterase [Candidatus Margulisiibacteriota bacterium]